MADIFGGIAAAHNKPGFVTGQVTVSTSGTPVQLPDVVIPDGFRLTIIARTGNTGIIYLAESAAKLGAEWSLCFDGLQAGLALSLRITNANLVWLDARERGDGISWIVERD